MKRTKSYVGSKQEDKFIIKRGDNVRIDHLVYRGGKVVGEPKITKLPTVSKWDTVKLVALSVLGAFGILAAIYILSALTVAIWAVVQ